MTRHLDRLSRLDLTAFTLVHSLTFTFSVRDVLRLPSTLVEPMIAASIVVVALSSVLWPRRSHGWARLITAFFSASFTGSASPEDFWSRCKVWSGETVGIAIVAFSRGVELGHQGIVLPLFGALSLARRTRTVDVDRERFSLAILSGGSLPISLAGMVYFIAAVAR